MTRTQVRLNEVEICYKHLLVNKKELTPAAMEFLAEQTTLRLEYDLYNHIKMRLVEQMRRLGIKPESM